MTLARHDQYSIENIKIIADHGGLFIKEDAL